MGDQGAAVSARQLPDEIAGQLLQMIRSGAFGIGARLPSERDLCVQFAVSRAVVREALSRLKSEGLVEARAGSGVYVLEQSSSNAFRIEAVEIGERKSLEQAMELLVAVEVAATRLAALRRDDDDLKRMKRALIGMEYAIASDELGDDKDFEFHAAIVAATHNPHFVALCKHLEFGVRNIIRKARANTRAHHAELLDAVQDEHKQIYAAICQSDAEQAATAAERHLRNAAGRIRIYLTDTHA